MGTGEDGRIVLRLLFANTVIAIGSVAGSVSSRAAARLRYSSEATVRRERHTEGGVYRGPHAEVPSKAYPQRYNGEARRESHGGTQPQTIHKKRCARQWETQRTQEFRTEAKDRLTEAIVFSLDANSCLQNLSIAHICTAV